MDRAAYWPRAKPEGPKKKRSQEPRWFLGDPSLTGLSGHSARYFQAIADELRLQKRTVHILGNRQLSVDLARTLTVDPVFTLACDARPVVVQGGLDNQNAREAICRRHEDAILKDMRRLHRMYCFHSDDVILLNSFRQWALEGVVAWLEGLPTLQAPTIVFVLHYTPNAMPGEDGPEGAEYQRAFERMAVSPLRERFVLMADSRELQHEFNRISQIRLGLLPIPHCGSIPAASQESQAGKIRFAFVGEARTDKGFQLLPDLVAALRSKAGVSLEFWIQGYSPERDAMVGHARDRLEQFEEVTLFPDPLTDGQYKALIADADIILLPYPQRHYYAQTSGVLAEAISGGTPAIVPSGTWMAAQVQEYGAGIVFEAGNLASLIKACEQAIATLPELRDRSAHAAIKWSQVHNAANFFAKVEDRIRTARNQRPAAGLSRHIDAPR